jgi:alkanesulfonate monooxygenase SsuD/methylene tetrahydromethanopterin reductase-like flavin-dependent oxidoreductase (luciferase family)
MSPSFGVHYDFRNPAPWRRRWADCYAQALEQIAWVDANPAFGSVVVSEHHLLDDGYLPSTMAMAAAVAVRTSHVNIGTNILPLPLHNAIRVAEDALVVDALSDGRFRLGLGNGYRPEEFVGLGTSTQHRAARMNEGLAILRGAFSGKPFAHSGVHWSFPELTVSPTPDRPGGPPIWLGGTAPAAIERAATRADGFFAATNEEVVAYLDACERLGVPEDRRRTCRTLVAVVTDDPERALAELGAHAVYIINNYIEWGYLKLPPFTDARAVSEMGLVPFVDANGAKALIEEAHDLGVQEILVPGFLPGESAATATPRLDYLAREVIPAFVSAPTAA